jgi:hypothetical protein
MAFDPDETVTLTTGDQTAFLIEMKRLWSAATDDERAAFMDWILNAQAASRGGGPVG